MKKPIEKVKKKVSNERSNNRHSMLTNEGMSACKNDNEFAKKLIESAKYKEENTALKEVLEDAKEACMQDFVFLSYFLIFLIIFVLALNIKKLF